jgi:hypothetical protein
MVKMVKNGLKKIAKIINNKKKLETFNFFTEAKNSPQERQKN